MRTDPSHPSYPWHRTLCAVGAMVCALGNLSPRALASDGMLPLESDPTLSAGSYVPTGGSSDILKVNPKDASLVAMTPGAFLELRIEPSVYDVLWQGVLDGTYQYLAIEDCYFFLEYSEADNTIYAYDWLSLQYRVRPKQR